MIDLFRWEGNSGDNLQCKEGSALRTDRAAQACFILSRLENFQEQRLHNFPVQPAPLSSENP